MSHPQSPDPLGRRPAAMAVPERRGHSRLRYLRPATLSLPGSGERHGVILDLALDGLSLQVDRPLSPGSRGSLVLTLDVPGAPTATRPVQFKSLYSSYIGPGQFRVGLVFLNEDPERDEDIRRLLAG